MAKKKEMNRTAGTAKRLTGRSEGIATKLKYGAPLTGSASGVKSISLKDVGETLTQGIVTLGKKGLKMDPAALAFALPIGKLGKAAGLLRSAGKVEKAAALEARIGAKTAGKIFGGSERGLPMERSLDVGGRARAASEKVFPRLPSMGGIPKATRTFDTYADPLLEGAGRFKGKGGRTLQLPDNAAARFKAIDRTFSNLGAVRPAVPGAKAASSLPKRVVGKLPAAGSVEMVKKTAKQFGQKVSGKEAKNISRLLRGRDR
jgi:hypothetical protein